MTIQMIFLVMAALALVTLIGWMPKRDMAEFTHKGWFGICPVYMRNDPDTEDCMEAVERSLIFYPLFWLSGEVYILIIMLKTDADPDYEPSFPFLVTGEL